jgi:hypothetical protein
VRRVLVRLVSGPGPVTEQERAWLASALAQGPEPEPVLAWEPASSL